MATYVITGASSGIGAALARELGRRGHSIGLIARREEKLAELAAELRARGATVAVAPADVSDRQACFEAMETLVERLGAVDVLVANAGVGAYFRPDRWDNDAIERAMAVNFHGAVYCAEALAPQMIQRRSGTLAVVSSVVANRGLPGSAPYSASKAAVSTFWEGMRLELKPHGVRCLTIHPGFIDTPMTAEGRNPQPFKIPVEQAAVTIADGLASRRRMLTFPWQFAVLQWVMRRVPVWLFDLLMGKRG